MANSVDEPIVPAPVGCPPASVVIDGDVTVDISNEDIQSVVDQICECIETQTTELCECFTQQINELESTLHNDLLAICDKLENLEIPKPDLVITPPCQPCIAVDGYVDDTAFIVFVNGETQYYNSSGQLTAEQAEVLSSCDPRCGCASPCPDSETCCECSSENFQELADTLITMGML